MHERIGQHGKKFKMYKLRSLQGEYSNSVTTEKTHQYLPIGKFLSYSKLDETPQLLNILRGEMSFVGPRPDVAGYADQLEGDDHIILNVKPGITGPAQIKYSREAELLQQQPNPKKYNDEVLWPDKVQINKDYVKNQSFSQDLFYLLATIFPLQ